MVKMKKLTVIASAELFGRGNQTSLPGAANQIVILNHQEARVLWELLVSMRRRSELRRRREARKRLWMR